MTVLTSLDYETVGMLSDFHVNQSHEKYQGCNYSMYPWNDIMALHKAGRNPYPDRKKGTCSTLGCGRNGTGNQMNS